MKAQISNPGFLSWLLQICVFLSGLGRHAAAGKAQMAFFFFKVSLLKSFLQAVISAELLHGCLMELQQHNQAAVPACLCWLLNLRCFPLC